MARTIPGNQTAFFRTVIEELIGDEWCVVKFFGPYDAPAQCRDWDKGWSRVDDKYEAGTRRRKAQKQVVVTTLRGECEIGWEDA